MLFFEFTFFIVPKFIVKFQPSAVLVSILDDLTNQERVQNNLPVLKENSLLSKAAELKVRDMVEKGYFAHTSPEGKTPWYWIDQVGYKYNYAGENLAVNFSDTKDVTEAWMNSPTHRANIVKSSYAEIGSAVATGTYKGRESVFVVQIYANPIETVAKATENTASLGVVATTNDVVSSKIVSGESGGVLGTTSSQKVTDSISLIRDVESQKQQSASFLERSFASPRQSTNSILIILLGLVLLAFLLNIFVKISVQYRDVITNGLIIITLILLILLINLSLGKENVVVVSSIDYASGLSV